ncbi:DUF3613 domain-containing protein [Stagnimonas aquatica]|uniref:DUF3613 domain-containing protein n=1 Tax=Stagnimonas aquatica TaxID=2689987 RepID=A0A3N0VJW5_9GAMM|nr:DUF3613 domain-containing protein [Stagnimonas aquatica]ROH92981.1 DUF3613 domain-containing protein [Stagnimonas aquatica]
MKLSANLFSGLASLIAALTLSSWVTLAAAQTDQRQFAADAGREPPAKAEAGSEPVLGADSHAWIDLQASGSAAAGAVRPLPGEVADAIYQRYLDSFKHPIPEQFTRESAGSQGQSGGNGSSSN